jgi:hypothetical protein
VLTIPGVFASGRAGWRMARDPEADAPEKILGWILVAISGLGALACAALLGKTLA